jgi:hypothetical protein
MKYILVLSTLLMSALSFAIEPEHKKLTEQANIAKYQSVLEYCHANPHNEDCKNIDEIFDLRKSRSIILEIWRFICGKKSPYDSPFADDHWLFWNCREIGRELNWTDEKIEEETEKTINRSWTQK